MKAAAFWVASLVLFYIVVVIKDVAEDDLGVWALFFVPVNIWIAYVVVPILWNIP